MDPQPEELFVIVKKAQGFARTFVNLINNSLRACAFRFYPWFITRIKYRQQSFPTFSGVRTHFRFPYNGNFSVSVFLRDVFHDDNAAGQNQK
jgi:hypothetical protein